MAVSQTKQPVGTAKICQDHLGNTYPSLQDMLKQYDIPKHIYYRYHKKMTFFEILTKYKPRNMCIKDHLGNNYPSENAMCEKYKINNTTFASRLKNGIPLKEALTTSNKRVSEVIDHLGIKHNNEKDMCKAHKIPYTTYMRRKKNEWPLELALTDPTNKHRIKDRTGKTKISQYGQKMTIIACHNANDIHVAFEDGTVIKTNYKSFNNTSIKNPNLKTGYKRPRIAYELIDGTVALYYKCEKCGLEDVGTWQQIAAHQCQKNNNQIDNLTSLPVQQYNNKKQKIRKREKNDKLI